MTQELIKNLQEQLTMFSKLPKYAESCTTLYIFEAIKEITRLNAIAESIKWISVTDRLPPDDHKPVLAIIDINGMKKAVRAIWVKEKSINCDDWNFEDGSIYDETTDAYYWPEDWYEFNQEEEIHWALSYPVTHWMPIPAFKLAIDENLKG